MKRILWLMALCLSFSAVRAGEAAHARKVLDATAALITGKSGVKANFKADNFVDGVLQGSASGTMCLQGEKFHITTPEMVTWYNGETQWSYIKANEEVNVSVPTEEEKQSMNPYSFVGLYKKGYDCQMKETTLRGKPCYEVTLTAQDRSKSLLTVIIDIDQRTSAPMCIRMQQDNAKHWTRITIHQFHTGQSFKAADFEFDARRYPEAEIIDLR